MANEYNSEGRLPIHEAAFRDYDNIVERIISDIALHGGRRNSETEDNRTEEEKERLRILHQAQVQEMVESITYDYFRLTPLLAATIGDARRTIECLISHGARVTCRDGNNRSMASIAIFKQNADLFLYLAKAPYANELDLWNTLITMFTSRELDESSAAGGLLEQLTSLKNISFVWPKISNLRPVEKALQVLIQAVNNATNANDSLITSCLIIFYNLLYVEPNVRNIFSQNEEGARALIKMRKTNEAISLLFLNVVYQLCDDVRCIEVFVNHNLIGEIQILLDTDTMNISNAQILLYFGILSKIAHCTAEYQTLIQNSSATKRTILEQAIDLLERFDRDLTIAILRFIRDLCFENEQQQQICAENHLLIAHLLSALNSMHKDVQRSSVDTLQMIAIHNTVSQYTILKQGGAEQLLILLNKATLPKLRISIISTLWSLTGDDPSRRQSMAYSIGVSNLVDALNFKSSDQTYIILDAISELLRRVPTEDQNIPLKLGRRHCIPPIVRLLTIDRERKLLLKCLYCIQQLCVLSTFRPCRMNQTIFQKANGLNHLLVLIRRANKDKFIQAKAITTIAYAIFHHKENKEILTKTVAQQLFKRIASLLKFGDEEVKIKVGLGLVTFICNDTNYYNFCQENIPLNHNDWQFMLTSNNIYTRCNAAFQIIGLIRLFPDINSTECMGQALMSLFRLIGDRNINDEEKILATDIIGRLARTPTGFGTHKHSGVCEAIIASDGLEHLIALLNSPNIILHGNAAVTIDCLVRDSPEGQRRVLKQCRIQKHYLDILRKYTSESSTLRTRIDELSSLMPNKQVHLPPIRTARQHNGVTAS